MSGMHNLQTLIKRLEAATSRLEDIASSSAPEGTVLPGPAVGGLLTGSTPNGDATSTSRSLASGVAAPGTASDTEAPPAVEAFDRLLDEAVIAFSSISDGLGGIVQQQCNAFCTAFRAQRDVILVASKAKQPSQTSPVYQDILKDLIKGIEEIQVIREKNRKSPYENHLSMIADGTGVLSWVTISPSPDKYVAEVLGGAQFYGNKILSANKDKESVDVEWVKSFVKLCGALIHYIKEYHSKGLQWNNTGINAEDAVKQVKESSSSAGAPPPPPPPPMPQFDNPPPPPQLGVKSPSASTGDMGAVFADLNRGEAVTSGLRKVDKSEMTHKNPALRAQGSGAVLERSDSASSTRSKSPMPPTKKIKPESMRTKKPPRTELDGNKWIVENHENTDTKPVKIDAERNQSILISKCKSAVIQVNGKANAISIDNCSRLDLLIDSLVSSVEVINSSNFRMQVLGTLPSVQLDKVDGATIFLSRESLQTEVYTSKCTSVNITLPPKSDQDDSVECPVPEQIKTTVVDGKLVNEIVLQESS